MTKPIPQSITCEPPPHALRVLEVLEGAGFEAWVVGGWVRDALMGEPSHDVDVTTSALWQQSAAALRAAGLVVHETGAAHGTVTAVVGGSPVEVTTYRVEGAYSDHRHPDEVRFVGSVLDDLSRRDFTINAIAYHPARGLLDPFGGRRDLEAGLIRAVGDPAQRFEEDALRVLRAVRFACRMGFVMEGTTHRALRDAASGLAGIARERIGQELDGIVTSGRVGWALLHETDVMCAAIPELSAMRGFDQRSPYHAFDVLEHTAHVCNACEAFTAGVAPRELRWAALLHDVGKPATFTIDEAGRGHFYGHPAEGALIAERVMRRLGLPTALVRAACALVRYHDHVMTSTQRSVRRTLVLLDRACPGRAYRLAHQLLDLKRADAVSKVWKVAGYAVELDEVDRALRRERGRGRILRAGDLAVDGADIMRQFGMTPGPAVGEVLSALLDAVVNAEVENTREALLAMAPLAAGTQAD
ncbi:MAG: HD domain-containing protein [Acidobacteriota bacterium]|nr:HD domain-containing protein [Acidobacteriota bacterium]